MCIVSAVNINYSQSAPVIVSGGTVTPHGHVTVRVCGTSSVAGVA